MNKRTEARLAAKSKALAACCEWWESAQDPTTRAHWDAEAHRLIVELTGVVIAEHNRRHFRRPVAA